MQTKQLKVKVWNLKWEIVLILKSKPIDRQFVYKETNILVSENCRKNLENSKSYMETISSSFNSAIAHIFSTISSPRFQKKVIRLICAI